MTRRARLVLVAGALALTSCGRSGGAAPIRTDADGAPITTLAPGATAAPAPTTTIVKIPLTRILVEGAKGDDVAYLQQRLKDLKFDPGSVDGKFGTSVTMAVWAFQKLIGLTGSQIDGKVTPDLWSRMQDPLVLSAKRPNPTDNHLEVDIPLQVAILWTKGQPSLITHISTGSGLDWCENGVCGTAVTPAGVYKFDRRYSGWRQSELGILYNPVYFNYSIAVHGAIQVPKQPASHGCVRIPMHISQYFPTLVHNGDQVFIFDGVKEPEDYGSPAPKANHKDPNASATSSVDPLTTDPNATTTTVKTTATTKAAGTTKATVATTAAATTTIKH